MRLNVENYKAIMKDKNLTAENIARLAGMAEYTVNWIFEHKFCEVSTLERFAAVVGCDTKEIALPDPDNVENVIEWIKNENTATLSLTQKSMINKVIQLAEMYPDKCRIVAENNDGSICARIPLNWVKVSPPRRLTDEQKKMLTERLHGNIFYSDTTGDEME